MLSCQECERYLPAFLDQALEMAMSLDVEAHLQHCSPCVERATNEQRLRTLVRQSLRLPDPPDELKRTMIRRAIQADRPPRWRAYFHAPFQWRDFLMGIVAAALVVLLLPHLVPEFSGDPEVQKVVREASLAYGTYTTQHMPLEVVSADDAAVTQWLNTRMGYPLKIPCITDRATQLLGGRVCRILDRKSAALIYQRHGIPLVLFAFRGDHISLSLEQEILPHKQRSFQMRYVSGRPVAMWQREGVVYSIVGDMHRDDLMQVVRTVSYR